MTYRVKHSYMSTRPQADPRLSISSPYASKSVVESPAAVLNLTRRYTCRMFPLLRSVFVAITLVVLCFGFGLALHVDIVNATESSKMMFRNELSNSTVKFAIQDVQSGNIDINSRFCNAEPNSSCEITAIRSYQYLVLAGIPADAPKHFAEKHGVSGSCTVTLNQYSGEYLINTLCP
jgi:hypothetical protein